MSATFSDRELAECAEREVKQRMRVYPNLVAGGRMRQSEADRQTEMMREIARQYRAKADAEAAKERLL